MKKIAVKTLQRLLA